MFLNACYNGIGRTVGGILSGKLKDHVGTARMFAYFGWIDVAVAIILFVYLIQNDCPDLDSRASVEKQSQSRMEDVDGGSRQTSWKQKAQ